MLTTAAIPPANTLVVPYTSFPPNSIIHFRVTANQRVDVFVMDAEGVQAFNAGLQAPSWGGGLNQFQHEFTVLLQPRPVWNLVIRNTTTLPVIAQYEAVISRATFGGSGTATGMSGSWP